MAKGQDLARLSVQLDAQTAEFQKGMNQAAGYMKKFDKSAKRSNKYMSDMDRQARRVGNALKVMAVAFVSTKLIGGLKSTYEELDKVAKTSARLGLTTDSLMELNHAAELSGVSTETLAMAMQRSTRRIAEAAQGTGEAVNAIKELGLSAAQLNSLSPDKQLYAMADALQAIPNQADRVRLSMKLFDSEGVKLINMLQNGSAGLRAYAKDANDLGIVFDTGMLRAVEDANDAMLRFNKSSSALGTAFSVALAPYIKLAADWLVELTNRFQIAGRGSEAFGGVIQAVAQGFIIAFNAMKTALSGWNNLLNLAVVGVMKLKGTAEEYAAAVDIYNAGIDEANKDVEQLILSLYGQDDAMLKILATLKDMDIAYKNVSLAAGKAAENVAVSFKAAEESGKAVANSVGNSMTGAFNSMMDGAFKFEDVMKGMIKGVLSELFKVLVVKQAISSMGFAQGGVFQNGNVTAFAKGGVVASPTLFPMSGGRTGIMSENSPEAIMPLQRDSSGSLGVKSVAPIVNIYNNNGGSVSTSESDGELNVYIDATEAAIAGRILRGTSPVSDAMMQIGNR